MPKVTSPLKVSPPSEAAKVNIEVVLLLKTEVPPLPAWLKILFPATLVVPDPPVTLLKLLFNPLNILFPPKFKFDAVKVILPLNVELVTIKTNALPDATPDQLRFNVCDVF